MKEELAAMLRVIEEAESGAFSHPSEEDIALAKKGVANAGSAYDRGWSEALAQVASYCFEIDQR